MIVQHVINNQENKVEVIILITNNQLTKLSSNENLKLKNKISDLESKLESKNQEIIKLKDKITNYEVENNNLKQINELKRKVKLELITNKPKINKHSSIQKVNDHTNLTHNAKKACKFINL